MSMDAEGRMQEPDEKVAHALRQAAEIEIKEFDFPSRVPVIAPLIQRFRKGWNSISTRWYVRSSVHQQRQFNDAILEALHGLHLRQTELSHHGASRFSANDVSADAGIGTFEHQLEQAKAREDALRQEVERLSGTTARQSAWLALLLSDQCDGKIWRVDLRLPTTSPAPSRFPWRLNKLCDIEDWGRPGFADLASDIVAREPGHSVPHRKLWEFTQTVYALQQLGLWNERSVGLSVAGGHEGLLYYATHHVGRIVAVDRYGEGAFAQAEAADQFLTHPEVFAPYAWNAERLQALHMDALDLAFPDNTFDFVYTLSSIEHFGGIAPAEQAMREMARVVKPGGAVVLVTECAINGRNILDYFFPEEFDTLVAASGLTPIEDFDWSLSDATLAHGCDLVGTNMVDMIEGRITTPVRAELTDLTKSVVTLSAFGTVSDTMCMVLEKTQSPGPSLPILETDLRDLDRLIEEIRTRNSRGMPA